MTSAAAVGRAKSVSQAVIPQSPDTQTSERSGRKPAGYGLPCAKCRTYYPTDLPNCPVCQSPERVSPVVFTARPVEQPLEEIPDLARLEEERERFLRDFKAQMLTSQMQYPSTSSSQCSKPENHRDGVEAASVCQGCYDHLQERVDVLEAALHMDLKEAAQIVYDAVWAVPSDSAKTYENAANALLTELRKRSGVTPTYGLLQPLTD